jgi:hypothetical protein
MEVSIILLYLITFIF